MASLWLSVFLMAAAIYSVHGYTTVSGTVFCDQCKDGQTSVFDFPVHGIKVQIVCPGSDGEPQVYREEITNWFGSYAIRFDGTPDLSSCYAQVAGGGVGGGGFSSDCSAAAGPRKSLKLVFDIFGFDMYTTTDPLLSQPAEPMWFCPRSAPVSPPVFQLPPIPQLPPSPSLPHFPPVFQLPPSPPIPQFPSLPPLPNFPPLFPISPPAQGDPKTPTVPFLGDSACSFRQWMMPEHRCYWKVVSPETKVAVVFGLAADRSYGSEVTLIQAMEYRGDPYRTLLREGITALLNSYDSIRFPYKPLEVIGDMNLALMGSKMQVLRTALRFLRANSGETTHCTCRFTNCNN